MKKKLSVVSRLVLLTTFLISAFALLDMEVVSAKNRVTTIKMNETISGRQTVGDHVVLFNSLLKDETYSVQAEDEKYYYIPFGNDTVYVSKRFATPKNEVRMAFTSKSSKSLITKRIVTVYAAGSTSGKVIGKIVKDVRVPVFTYNKTFYRVNYGGTSGYVRITDLRADPGVPVLMYHHLAEKKVGTPFENNLSVLEVSKFKQQMDYLYNNGWIALPIEEFEEWKQYQKNLPAKIVLITFDDGYKSNIKYAYPILKRYNMPAVSFLIASRIPADTAPWDVNGAQMLSLAEMNETNDVFNYQHHTYAMHSFNSMTRKSLLESESAASVTKDLIAGKLHIEKSYNKVHDVRYLAYPYGKYTRSTIDVSKTVGIYLAFTIEVGNVKLPDNRYQLKRQRVHSTHSIKDFEKMLTGK